MMQQAPFLLDMSDAVFFGALAYAAFYGATLLAGGLLLFFLVRHHRQEKSMDGVVGWLTGVCLAGALGEVLWYRANPGATAGPTYWRHLAVLALGIALYLLFRLDQKMRDQKK
jgi:hypothetical protein